MKEEFFALKRTLIQQYTDHPTSSDDPRGTGREPGKERSVPDLDEEISWDKRGTRKEPDDLDGSDASEDFDDFDMLDDLDDLVLPSPSDRMVPGSAPVSSKGKKIEKEREEERQSRVFTTDLLNKIGIGKTKSWPVARHPWVRRIVPVSVVLLVGFQLYGLMEDGSEKKEASSQAYLRVESSLPQTVVFHPMPEEAGRSMQKPAFQPIQLQSPLDFTRLSPHDLPPAEVLKASVTPPSATVANREDVMPKAQMFRDAVQEGRREQSSSSISRSGLRSGGENDFSSNRGVAGADQPIEKTQASAPMQRPNEPVKWMADSRPATSVPFRQVMAQHGEKASGNTDAVRTSTDHPSLFEEVAPPSWTLKRKSAEAHTAALSVPTPVRTPNRDQEKRKEIDKAKFASDSGAEVTKGNGFVLFLGSYRSEKGAYLRGMVDTLKSEPHPLIRQTVTINNETYTRLYAGPFASRNAAIDTKKYLFDTYKVSSSITYLQPGASQFARLERVDGPNVGSMGSSPQPRRTERPPNLFKPEAKLTRSGHYALRLGSFSNKNGDSSGNLLRKISALGAEGFQTDVQVNGQTFWRVYSGPFSDLKEAEQARGILQQHIPLPHMTLMSQGADRQWIKIKTDNQS